MECKSNSKKYRKQVCGRRRRGNAMIREKVHDAACLLDPRVSRGEVNRLSHAVPGDRRGRRGGWVDAGDSERQRVELVLRWMAGTSRGARARKRHRGNSLCEGEEIAVHPKKKDSFTNKIFICFRKKVFFFFFFNFTKQRNWASDYLWAEPAQDKRRPRQCWCK